MKPPKHNPASPKGTFASVAIGVASVVALTGCNTMDISREMKPPAALQTSQPVDQAGLSISTVPLSKGKSFDAYFGMDDPPPGLIALFVKAQNTSTNASWLLHKSNMRLASDQPGGLLLEPRTVEHRNKTAEGIATAGAVLISTPLMMAGNKAATDATVIQHNFALREWPNGTLDTNTSREGFVYFQFTSNPAPGKYFLQVEAFDLQSRQTNSFKVPVSL